MSIHHHRARGTAPRRPPRSLPREWAARTPGSGLLRGLLLGMVVFALAAVTGALLAGAAPAGPAPASRPASPVLIAVPADQPGRANDAAVDFAHSMIYSGATALVVSIAGMVMVIRRRRLW